MSQNNRHCRCLYRLIVHWEKILKFRILICLCCVALSGCVQLKFKPERVITDSVDAGKDVYETVKRNRAGLSERVFTHTLPLAAREDGQKAAAECFSFVRAAAASAAADKELQVLSESSELIETPAGLALRCSLVALL